MDSTKVGNLATHYKTSADDFTVSDVFHTGSPDSPLWEFKHGGGSFKRGDLVGLREIKRRASRHTLIHRDSFTGAPKMPPQPILQPPAPPVESAPQDPIEARFGAMESRFHELYSRLAHAEDAFASLSSRCQSISEGLARCHQWSNELSTHLLSIVPDPENPVHKDGESISTSLMNTWLTCHKSLLYGPKLVDSLIA